MPLDRLQKLIDAYSDADWDGWEWGDCIDPYEIEGAIFYSWDPSGWFLESMAELKESWRANESAETINDGQYLGCGDAQCDRAEAIDWLKGEIKIWENEFE